MMSLKKFKEYFDKEFKLEELREIRKLAETCLDDIRSQETTVINSYTDFSTKEILRQFCLIITMLASRQDSKFAGYWQQLRDILNSALIENQKNYPFLIATAKGFQEIFDALIDHVKPDKIDHNEMTALHFAARRCDIYMIESLMNRGANSKKISNQGHIPFYSALENQALVENPESLKKILDLLKIPNPEELKVYNGGNMLHLASVEGKLCIIESLIKLGFDPAKETVQGVTPMQFAFLATTPEAARWFLSNGYYDESKRYCTHNPVTQSLLIKYRDKEACFANAIKEGNLEDVKIAIDFGVNLKENIISTLLKVIESENFEIFKFLWPYWDNHSDCELNLLFQQASRCKGLEFVNFLLDRGHDVNSVLAGTSRTAIFYALEKQNSKLFDFLCKKGARLDLKDKEGNTLLHLLTSYDDDDLVVDLLSKFLDINTENEKGETPVLTAFNRGDYKLIRVLLAKGANPNLGSNTSGLSLLDLAVKNNNFEEVKFYLSKGADPNLRNKKTGKTAIFYCKNFKIFKLLEQYGAEIYAKDANSLICLNEFIQDFNTNEKDFQGLENICSYLTAREDFLSFMQKNPEVIINLFIKMFKNRVNNFNYALAKQILKRGFDINARFNNRTVIHEAIDNNFSEVEWLELLLDIRRYSCNVLAEPEEYKNFFQQKNYNPRRLITHNMHEVISAAINPQLFLKACIKDNNISKAMRAVRFGACINGEDGKDLIFLLLGKKSQNISPENDNIENDNIKYFLELISYGFKYYESPDLKKALEVFIERKVTPIGLFFPKFNAFISQTERYVDDAVKDKESSPHEKAATYVHTILGLKEDHRAYFKLVELVANEVMELKNGVQKKTAFLLVSRMTSIACKQIRSVVDQYDEEPYFNSHYQKQENWSRLISQGREIANNPVQMLS